MSSAIWTQCAGSSEIRPLADEPWRVVEAQHRVATRKLVDSDAEQGVLEELLEAHKPPAVDAGRLHYLLSTPFRYPPLDRGSRFATRWEPGVWYGALTLGAALAEVAFSRLLFLEGTRADLGQVAAELTAFRARLATPRGIDLTTKPFDDHRAAIASKTSYVLTQPLGAAMRAAGVEAFRYRSARDPDGGTNVGVFAPRAFTGRRPFGLETWHATATRTAVEFARHDYFARAHHRFERGVFLVDGKLPGL
jgi:hypothetical protein